LLSLVFPETFFLFRKKMTLNPRPPGVSSLKIFFFQAFPTIERPQALGKTVLKLFFLELNTSFLKRGAQPKPDALSKLLPHPILLTKLAEGNILSLG